MFWRGGTNEQADTVDNEKWDDSSKEIIKQQAGISLWPEVVRALLDEVTFGRRSAWREEASDEHILKPNILMRETSKGKPWEGSQLLVLSEQIVHCGQRRSSRGENVIKEIRCLRILQMAYLKTTCLKPRHNFLKSWVSKPQFPHLKNGNNCLYLVGLLRGSNDMFLAQDKPVNATIKVSFCYCC